MNAKQLYEFAMKDISGMCFCYVTNEEYKEEAQLLQERFEKSQTVPGTRKYHCFKPLNTAMVEEKYCSTAKQKYNKGVMKNIR